MQPAAADYHQHGVPRRGAKLITNHHNLHDYQQSASGVRAGGRYRNIEKSDAAKRSGGAASHWYGSSPIAEEQEEGEEYAQEGRKVASVASGANECGQVSHMHRRQSSFKRLTVHMWRGEDDRVRYAASNQEELNGGGGHQRGYITLGK